MITGVQLMPDRDRSEDGRRCGTHGQPAQSVARIADQTPPAMVRTTAPRAGADRPKSRGGAGTHPPTKKTHKINGREP